MTTDEQIIEILRGYDVLGVPTEGTFNVVSEINNLKKNIYFSSQEELISDLIAARAAKDMDKFKEILDTAIKNVEDKYKPDIDAIEKEQGYKYNNEQRQYLTSALEQINMQEARGDISAEDAAEAIKQEVKNMAFQLSSETGTRLLEQADGTLQVFDGYFNNVLFSNIFSQAASVPEIVAFQNYLIQNDIATPQDFAGTKGVYSEKLRGIIETVMNWADKNVNAAEGTPLRNQILSEEPVFFSDVEYENMDVSFERNLFNYAVKELAKANVDLKKFALEEELEAEKIKYLPPKKETLDDMVEAYFVANTGRSPSAKELSDWSTALAQSYSDSYAQLERFKYEVENMDVKVKPIYDTKFTVDPVTEQPRRVDTVTGQRLDFGNLQEMQPMTPAEIFEAKFEEELGGEMEAWERGSQIREMQNNIMSAMYGG